MQNQILVSLLMWGALVGAPGLVHAQDVPVADAPTPAPESPPDDTPPALGTPAPATADPGAPPQVRDDPQDDPAPPGADVPLTHVDPLEAAYSACIEGTGMQTGAPAEPNASPYDDAPKKAQDPQACLRSLVAQHPNTVVGKRARAVLDAVRVMQRSGVRLVQTDRSGAPKVPLEAPIAFGDIVARVPATVSGVGYGLAFGTGLAAIGQLNFPGIQSGVFIFGGGVIAVGAAVGFGTLGFWLSGPTAFRGQGSWLGAGGLLAGGVMGLAASASLVDGINVASGGNGISPQAAATIVISSGLGAAAAGAALGVSAASVFNLDDDQVAVANSLLYFGAVTGGALAIAVGGTVVAYNGDGTGASLGGGSVYVLATSAATAVALLAVPKLNFNAGEMLVASLGMTAAAGVMLLTSGIASGTLSLGYGAPALVGLSTAAAAGVGYLGTAALLYALRDDMRPFIRTFEKAGVTPMFSPPTIAVDRRGKPAIMAPVVGLSF